MCNKKTDTQTHKRHDHTWCVGKEGVAVALSVFATCAFGKHARRHWNGLDMCGLRLWSWVDNKAVHFKAWLGANVLEPVAAHAHGAAGKVEDGRGLARTAAADEGDDRLALKFFGALLALFDEVDCGGNVKVSHLLHNVMRHVGSVLVIPFSDRFLECANFLLRCG